MKMKKIIVTGMAFLAAMTVFAGCGSAGKEETNIAEEASTAGENENQEVSISSGESLTIPVSELTENAGFLSSKRRWYRDGSDRSEDF